MTTESHTDGPLGWLPDSQASRQAGLGVWQSFEEQLTQTLGSLADGTFVICEVWSQTPDGRTSRKYLQFALASGSAGRELTAEASALRYQLALDDNASAQEALIDSMGWSRPDETSNHRKQFPWPLAIAGAVSDSTRILRDVWGIQHPSQVTLKDIGSFACPLVAPGLTCQEILSLVTSWLSDMGADVGASDAREAEIGAILDERKVIVRADSSGQALEVSTRVADRPIRARDDTAILEALSIAALTGRPVIRGSTAEGYELSLDIRIPTDGLTQGSFVNHLAWLMESANAAGDHLESSK